MMTPFALVALSLLFWLLLTYMATHRAAWAVETAVLSVEQEYLSTRNRQVGRSPEIHRHAQTDAVARAKTLLGTWYGLVLILGLGLGSLQRWLCIRVEAAIHRLKTTQCLPTSTLWWEARNPALTYITEILPHLLPLILSRISPSSESCPFDDRTPRPRRRRAPRDTQPAATAPAAATPDPCPTTPS